MGLSLTLPETLHYPLTHIQQDTQAKPSADKPFIFNLPRVQLTTLGSKLDAQIDLANVEVVQSADALSFNSDWHLEINQTSHYNYPNCGQMYRWISVGATAS